MALARRDYQQAEQIIDALPATHNAIHTAKLAQNRNWLVLQQSSDTGYLIRAAGKSSVLQKQLQAQLREWVEKNTMQALAELLTLSQEEQQLLYSDPDAVLSRFSLSPEVQCVAASLLSVLGHCYLDIFRAYPQMDYLKDKKKACFDCADKTNPWRVDIKAGRELPGEALAAMTY